ncbi:hypothetical protein JCM6882_000541 [Rhodosporidiobolus microsporus]
MSGAHDPTPEPPHPLQRAIDELERVIRSGRGEGEDSDEGVRGAVEGLCGWMKRLIEQSSLNLTTAREFAFFARLKCFVYRRPSSEALKAAAASASEGAEGEVGEGDEKGRTLRALVEAVVAVLEWGVDGALAETRGKEGREAWEEVLVGMMEGVKRHLVADPVKGSKWKPNQLAYRTLLSTHLSPTLLRVFLPNPAGVPPSSAQEIDDGGDEGSEGVPIEAKYVALDLMGELLSKHEPNKERLREMVPPANLGRVLANSLDSHLSRLTLELAFRLTPGRLRHNPTSPHPKDDPQTLKRKAFIDGLFSNDWFGNCFKELRVRYEGISNSNWADETLKLLNLMADKTIKRSQRFVALSLTYNARTLLPRVTPDDDNDDSYPVSSLPPPLSALAAGDPGSYEPAHVWFCRHFIGATVDSGALRDEQGVDWVGEGDEEEERMVVPFEGVEKVFVQDLGTDLDLLRLTFLLRSSSPLRLNRRPHPAAPSHVGRTLNSAEESQVSDAVPRTHRLEMIITAKGDALPSLRKVIEERRARYPNLGKELLNYPHRFPPVKPPKPSKATASSGGDGSTTSSKSRSTAAATGKSVAFASTPAETVELREAKGQQKTAPAAKDKGKGKEKAKETAKKPDPPVKRAPRKSSEAVAPVEQVFPALPPPPSSSDYSVVAQAPAPGDDPKSQSQSQSQSQETRRRAEEAARLAKLEELEGEEQRTVHVRADTPSPPVEKRGEGAEGDGGMDVEPDFGAGDQDFGGGFEDDAQNQPRVDATSSHPASEQGGGDEDSLMRPSQIGRLITLPTSEAGEGAALPAELSKAKATPAAPPKSKDDKQPIVPPAAAKDAGRPRASTIGKPRPAEEEDVTPSQRAALSRKESQSKAAGQKEAQGGRVEKAKPKRTTTAVSSELSELSSEGEDEGKEEGEERGEKRPAKKEPDSAPKAGPPTPAKKAVPPAGATAAAASPADHDQPSVKTARKDAAAGPSRDEDDQVKRRRSPRLSGSSGSEGESVIVATAKTAKKAAAPPAKKVKVGKKGGAADTQDSPAPASAATGRPRRAAASASTKKVVAAMKPKKRSREEDSDEEDEESEPSTQCSEEDEEESTKKRAMVKSLTTAEGKGKTTGKAPAKKVVKSAAAPSRNGKKRKLSHTPSASASDISNGRSAEDDDADEPETDYDSYPGASLEPKRNAVSPARRYGKDKPVIKPAGGKRKAGQPRKKVAEDKAVHGKGKKAPSRSKRGRKSAEPDEGEEKEDETPQQTTAGTRTTRAQAKAKAKKVVKPSDVASTSGMEDIEDVRLSPLPTAAPKSKDKRVSEEIAPPFDLTSPRKSSARRAVAEGASSKSKETTPHREKPIQSFSQLVATPREDDKAEGQLLGDHTVERAGRAAEEGLEGLVAGVDYPDPDQDFFEPGYVDDSAFNGVPGTFEPLADASRHVDPSCLEGARQAERLAARDLSLHRSFSSLLDPAKDNTFVERAVAALQPSVSASATAREQQQPLPPKPKPNILVEDTQSEAGAPNGPEEQRRAPVDIQPLNEDVEMPDAEPEKDRKEEHVDTDDLFSPAGDLDGSGDRFEVPMDHGVEADEEEMAAPGADLVVSAAEEGSDDRAPEAPARLRPPVPPVAVKPNSAPPLSSSQIRPLLVEKPVPPPRSAEAQLGSPFRAPAPAAARQPVASTSKAQLPFAAAAKPQPARPLQPKQHNAPAVPPAKQSAAKLLKAQPPSSKTRFALPPQQQQQQALPPAAAKPVQPILRSSRSRPSISAYSAGPLQKLKPPTTFANPFTSKAQLASSLPFPALPFAPRHPSQHAKAASSKVFASSSRNPLFQLPPLPPARKKKSKHKAKASGKGKERAEGRHDEPQGDIVVDEGACAWDEGDEALFSVLVNKNRDRRALRQAHHQQSVTRLDRQLTHYLTDVHDQTANVVDTARSYASAVEGASSPSSRLLQLLQRSRDVNARLWQEAENELVAMGKQ